MSRPDNAPPLPALAAARAGSREALGELLENYRNYLLLVARQELDPGLRSKEGASDLVQQTFLEAQRDFARFQGNSEEELLAWLRQLLFNNLVNSARRYRATAKRQVSRELSLDVLSADCPPDGLSSDSPSPGDKLLAREQARHVLDAVGRLPEEYRRVLLLRCRENCSFEEIGRRLNRSKNAAQKLWARALDRLRQDLEADA